MLTGGSRLLFGVDSDVRLAHVHDDVAHLVVGGSGPGRVVANRQRHVRRRRASGRCRRACWRRRARRAPPAPDPPAPEPAAPPLPPPLPPLPGGPRPARAGAPRSASAASRSRTTRPGAATPRATGRTARSPELPAEPPTPFMGAGADEQAPDRPAIPRAKSPAVWIRAPGPTSGSPDGDRTSARYGRWQVPLNPLARRQLENGGCSRADSSKIGGMTLRPRIAWLLASRSGCPVPGAVPGRPATAAGADRSLHRAGLIGGGAQGARLPEAPGLWRARLRRHRLGVPPGRLHPHLAGGEGTAARPAARGRAHPDPAARHRHARPGSGSQHLAARACSPPRPPRSQSRPCEPSPPGPAPPAAPPPPPPPPAAPLPAPPAAPAPPNTPPPTTPPPAAPPG